MIEAMTLDAAPVITLGDLLDVVLPDSILRHLGVNTRKLLRLTSQRLRDEVDRYVSSLTINRFNIHSLTVRDDVPRRWAGLRTLVVNSCEPDSLRDFFQRHLSGFRQLETLDMNKFHSSIKPDVRRNFCCHPHCWRCSSAIGAVP